ncbi:MAG: response regulator transcription factor [Flavobacteriales bacterium]|nr:response regulator transcription factor [Flavobacteriales bacterium]
MDVTKKILLVDDEEDILEFIRYNLEKEGFDVNVAHNGREAINVAKQIKPDLVILDIMMPEMDGIETCQEIRSIPEMEHVVIAFLTARNEDYIHVAGLDSGGDDYITKPIKPRVLVSRVKALLRRSPARGGDDSGVIQSGPLTIDQDKHLVQCNGDTLELPRKEFELLVLLASAPGKVFRREEILDRVWGQDVIVGDRTIDVHIRKLREKLGDDFFRTIKGVGYKFEF